MLQTDALFAFRDAVQLLELKKHRIVGRVLRDIVESINLVEYLDSKTNKAEMALKEWFNDNPVMHREFRDFIKAKNGEIAANAQRDIHRTLSKFTHRTYKILLYGYALSSDDSIIYDEGWTLPQSVAMYYAFLGHFGKLIIENLKKFGALELNEVGDIWNQLYDVKESGPGS